MSEIYSDGTYAARNPTWHEEDGPFKASYIANILCKNGVDFESIAEVGCGTGTVLKSLRQMIGKPGQRWSGYDISGHAIKIAREGTKDGIDFIQGNFFESQGLWDVLLVIDVIEHIPDYMGFAERCRGKATLKVYHIPLDLHVSSVVRDSLLNSRISVGHLHYFTKSTALATLRDTGHDIVDFILTPGAVAQFHHKPSLKRALANIPRTLISLFSAEISTRLLGGHSLLVLAR